MKTQQIWWNCDAISASFSALKDATAIHWAASNANELKEYKHTTNTEYANGFESAWF